MAQYKIQRCARTRSSWRLSRCRPGTLRRFGHPSGVMAVGAEAECAMEAGSQRRRS